MVDEYGAFMGVTTLEDILEEIVGDIYDEHDQANGDSLNISSDLEYNMPEDKPDVYDIEQYDKLIGAAFMLDLKTGDNSKINKTNYQQEAPVKLASKAKYQSR